MLQAHSFILHRIYINCVYTSFESSEAVIRARSG